MSLSKRERLILISTLAAAALLLMDRIGFTPVAAAYQKDVTRAAAAADELSRTRRLLSHRAQMSAAWEQCMRTGLNEPLSHCESTMLGTLEGFARQSSVSISAMKPEHATPADGLEVVKCRATVVGRMRGMTDFLWQLENASIPMRIEKVQLSSSDSTKDSVTAQVVISTVCLQANEGAKQ